MTLDPLSAAALGESLKHTLEYSIGCDSITRVGRRWPVEIVTLKHHMFPFMVCFNVDVIRKARAFAAAGARVMLTTEASKNGRSLYVTDIREV